MRTHLRNRTRSTFGPNPVDYRTVLGMDSLPGRPTSAAQTTLSRIMTALDTNLLGTVHGILAAQVIKPQAKVLANDRGISCVTIDYDLLRGLDSADDRLF